MIEVLKGLIAIGEKQGDVKSANMYESGWVSVEVELKDGSTITLTGQVGAKEEE